MQLNIYIYSIKKVYNEQKIVFLSFIYFDSNKGRQQTSFYFCFVTVKCRQKCLHLSCQNTKQENATEHHILSSSPSVTTSSHNPRGQVPRIYGSTRPHQAAGSPALPHAGAAPPCTHRGEKQLQAKQPWGPSGHAV